MNKLQLAQRLLSEGGIPGSISSTLNQTWELAQVVAWIDSAYNDILTSSRFWNFMRNDFTMPLTNAVGEYAVSAAGITDFSEWIVDDIRCFFGDIATEQRIEFVPWPDFKFMFLLGSSRDQTGRPVFFSVTPSKSIAVSPKPNDSYVLVGEYQRSAQPMALDASVPVFPDQYHMAIVYRALMMFGAFHAESDKYANGQNEFRRVMSAMRSTELPTIEFGGTIA